MIDYLTRHYDDLLTSLLEHIYITFVSLFIALVITLPLGYWLSKHR
ncbi:hypothetical protein [Paenibacillus sp. NRS-1760]